MYIITNLRKNEVIVMAFTSTEIVIGKNTKYSITLRVDATSGKGFSCFVYGGDKPHVGAVSLISRKGEEQLIKIDGVATDLDIEAALTVSRIINDSFREAVSCTAGVELKNADEKDLKQLKTNFTAAARHFIGTYER